MTNNTPDYNNNLYFEKLQKSKNVAKNVASENSQDLTEQWKKGELPSGWYYVRLIRGEYRIDLYINGKNEWIDCPDNIIDTVVCKVPSYDAYMALIRAINNVTDDNAELKDLLKRVNEHFKWVDKDDPFYVEDELWQKIKEELDK